MGRVWEYPLPSKKPFTYEMCGQTLEDPYAWLEERDNPEVRSWVAEENAFTDRYFEGLGDVLPKRVAEKCAHEERPAYTSVTEENGVLYAMRHAADGSYTAVELTPDVQEKRVLLDSAMLDNRMNLWSIAPCPGRKELCAVFGLKHGAARMTVVVRDTEQNVTLTELDGTFSYAWASDGSGVYYSDAQQREDGTTENRLRFWSVATGEDRVLYAYPGHAAYGLVAAGSDGDVYLHVMVNYHDTSMVWVSKEGEVHPFPETPVEWHYIGAIGDRRCFLTDQNAPKKRVVWLKAGQFDWADAQEIVPEGNGALEGAAVVDGKVLTNHLEDVVSVLRVFDPKTGQAQTVTLPDPMGAVTLGGVSSDCGRVYCGFESFTCAPSVLCVEGEKARLVYCPDPEGMHTNLTVTRQFVPSKDGTPIPAFLVHRNDVTPTGAVPTLMYGYGGYGASTPPASKVVDLSVIDWAERGGLYVHCVLRGGSDYGAEWHMAGCKGNKRHCYEDFIAITEKVQSDGWTIPAKTAICGMSNGGLLMAVLTTMRPDLFGCVLASVPHTDMLRFVFDDRGPMYITEYGDPRTEELFAYMKSYSPYHNIHPGTAYPPIYIQTGEMDNNVPPYHGKKFAAALQEAGGPNPVLLRVLPMGSHDRGTGETCLRTTAEMEVFLAHALGILPGGMN